MNATCWPFSIASTAASTATIVLPAPTSPCSSRFIGMRTLHVVADLLERAALARREAERQHGAERVADAIVHARDQHLALGLRFALPQQQAHLEAEELLEHEPPLGGASDRR